MPMNIMQICHNLHVNISYFENEFDCLPSTYVEASHGLIIILKEHLACLSNKLCNLLEDNKGEWGVTAV